MSAFTFKDNSSNKKELYVEDIPLTQIAEQYSTPTYVYSKAAIEAAYKEFDGAFANHAHMSCYAVKANSNLGVLSLLASLGAGFDVVSGGELERALRAGAVPGKIVFSGVGKEDWEINKALQVGIACFNVESEAELYQLNNLAGKLGLIAPISIRINPDVDAGTHPYISTGLKENKFGVSRTASLALYAVAADMDNLNPKGIDCHIGSQITEIEPFIAALQRLVEMVDELEAEGISLEHIDLGGGLGVQYQDEIPVNIDEYASAIMQTLGHRKHQLVFEPGRYIVANAGILLTRAINLKENEGKHFVVVDAGMNDFLRPALYQSWQGISVVKTESTTKRDYDVVGPICETSDSLGKNRELAVNAGDLLAVHSAGAYGFGMSSNYNSRNRAAEVIVSGNKSQCVRERETIEDQLRGERLYQV